MIDKESLIRLLSMTRKVMLQQTMRREKLNKEEVTTRS